jgi:hypothetical protein
MSALQCDHRHCVKEGKAIHSISIETGPIVEDAMNDKTVGGIHWSFWIISVVTLIFNVMGVINYFVQMNADSLASFPESYRPIIEGRPTWATGGFAVAVFGGTLGCLLLLLRKSAAFYVFIASLLGVIVTMMHIFGVTGFSSFEIWIGVLMQLVVTAFLIWYSNLAESKG